MDLGKHIFVTIKPRLMLTKLELQNNYLHSNAIQKKYFDSDIKLV